MKLSLTTTIMLTVLLLSGCRTFSEKNLIDFNSIYNKSNSLSPQFYLSDNEYGPDTIAVHQGSILISDSNVRHSLLEDAGRLVAEKHCFDKGLKLRNIRFERIGSSGWVHVKASIHCASTVVAANKTSKPYKGKVSKFTGSGFFASKLGHIVTNEHVVRNCSRVTVGTNTRNQITATVLNTDRTNDLALLNILSSSMASNYESPLIENLVKIKTLLSIKGLLRSEDIELGEKIIVSGYPYGDRYSSNIKVTGGIVSSTRGLGNNSSRFQIDASAQPGNSGGPIYDGYGNIVGILTAQLNKVKVLKEIGSIPENVNFGIKASTIKQFLASSSLHTKWSKRSVIMVSKDIAKIARIQTLMVICHR